VRRTLAIMLLWLFFPVASGLAVTAQDGVLDLRGLDLSQPIRANGHWDFYWSMLLTPEDLNQAEPPKTTIKVPGLWSQDPAQYPTKGYATYRLRVLVDPGQKLALFFDATIWSASRIFVDGQEVAHLGRVGTRADSSVGGVATRIHEFQPQNTAFDLIIQVSNFEFFLCGITLPPQLGTLEAVTRDRNKEVAFDVFLVGALLIMGLYHLCLFALRTEDPSTFWFGCICCFVAIWQTTSRNGLLMLFIPDIGFDERLRVYNNTWTMSVASFTWYFHFVFRSSYARLVCWLTTAATLAFTAVLLLTKARIFAGVANIFHFITVSVILYTLSIVIRSALRKEEDGRIMLLGLSIVVFTAIHDIMAIRGIITSPSMTAGGLFAFIFFQSFFLARRFSNAFIKVKQSEKEIRSLSEDLKTLNNNLEKLVEEKIRDIRSIMEHIPLGVLMIKQDRKIHKDHSRRLQEFLDKERLETANATDLVFSGSNLNADEKSQAISCLDASLGEDAMNFAMNQHLLPSEIFCQDGPDRQRILELTWDPIVTLDNRIDKILVTMRDVTDLRRLQARSQEQQQELEYIAEIMNIPPDRFEHFLQTCDELLEQSRGLMEGMQRKGPSAKVLKLLFINMHTLKGAARGLYLKQLSQMFHAVEQYYLGLQEGDSWDLRVMRDQIEEVQKLVDYYKFMAHNRLGRHPEKSQIVEYHIAEIENLYQGLKAWPGPPNALIDRIRGLFYSKIFKDARLVFEDLFSSIPLLAKDLAKESPNVRLDTRGIHLSQRAEVIFRKIFIHLVRNAMDHGLEPAAERLKLGKSPEGTIHVHMQRLGDRLELRCYDDGRGLNLKRLEEIAIQGGLLPSGTNSSPQVIARLIFHPGMSTAREVSDISGRGIGMHAVQAFIEENQGSIAIELETQGRTPPDHTAFRLVIGLPFILFEEADWATRSLAKPA
jgi:signal transduction histidine kinase